MLMPSVNKVNQILARTTVPSNPWQGTPLQVEFALPQHLGKCVDNVLEFVLQVKTTSGTGSLVLAPTTYWCQRIEVLNGGQVIEQVEADEIHQETYNFLSDQQYNTLAPYLNANPAGGFADGISTSTTAKTLKFYLPLWANILNTAQIMPKGFQSEWRFRLTLAPSITVLDGTSGSNSISLEALTLYTTEANLSDSAAQQLEYAHRSGVAYRTIIRNKFTRNENSLPSTADYNVIMTTFTTDSAGLLVYIRAQDTTPDYFLDRQPLNYIALRDSANSELTINLPVPLILGFITPNAVSLPSAQPGSYDPNTGAVSNGNNFLFPFCSNLAQVLKTGKVLGGYKLTGQERVLLRPLTTLSNMTVCVISYEYVVMTVQAGKVVIERRA